MEIFPRQGAPRLSTTLVANFQRFSMITGVVDTGRKFATGIIDNSVGKNSRNTRI
jgi:hypothetical protein